MAVAAGLRHPSSGALAAVGEGGWWWSSSSHSAGNRNAGDMGFRTSNVNPLNADNRANALSVRCVQHLRLLFIFLRAGSPGRNGRNVFPKVAGSQIVGKYLAGKRN